MITLLVLNFILAIIVESYMQVRKEIEKNQIEQSFPQDLFCIGLSVLHQVCVSLSLLLCVSLSLFWCACVSLLVGQDLICISLSQFHQVEILESQLYSDFR